MVFILSQGGSMRGQELFAGFVGEFFAQWTTQRYLERAEKSQRQISHFTMSCQNLFDKAPREEALRIPRHWQRLSDVII